MSAPTRKPVVIAEATQELQAADVLGVLGTVDAGAAGPAGVASPRKSLTSQSSIAPVGLDLARGADSGDDDDPGGSLTGSVIAPLPERRRRLGKIVIGAIAACAVILVAAGIARIGHASSEPSAPSTSAGETPSAAPAAPPAANSPAVAPLGAPPVVGARKPDPGSAGTVRLDRPTMAGHVWIDGTKVSGASAVVSCGTHQIKVGRGRKHSIDVPCGGEIAVSR